MFAILISLERSFSKLSKYVSAIFKFKIFQKLSAILYSDTLFDLFTINKNGFKWPIIPLLRSVMRENGFMLACHQSNKHEYNNNIIFPRSELAGKGFPDDSEIGISAHAQLPSCAPC